MRVKNLLTLGVTLAGLGLVVTSAHSQRTGPSSAPSAAPPQVLPQSASPVGIPAGPGQEETFTERLARKTRLKEDDVKRLLAALAPEVQAELAKGKTMDLPGLGTFRIVLVPEHRDLGKDGRPITVPAANTVEFLPDPNLVGAVPSAGGPAAVQPAAVVPNPTFQQFPNQTRDPGQKVPPVRQPNTRTKG